MFKPSWPKLTVVLRLESGVQSSQLLIGVDMKRAYVLAAVALVVVAGFVGQRLLSNDDEPAPPASRPTLDAQATFQAEQYAAAIEKLRKDTEAIANPHQLVVTIRDELPMGVWDSNCRLDPGFPAPALAVSEGLHRPITGAKLPSKAKPLDGGGCVATVKVAVPDVDVYSVGIVFEGNGISDGTEPQPPLIKHQGKSQKVTIVE